MRWLEKTHAVQLFKIEVWKRSYAPQVVFPKHMGFLIIYVLNFFGKTTESYVSMNQN